LRFRPRASFGTQAPGLADSASARRKARHGSGQLVADGRQLSRSGAAARILEAVREAKGDASAQLIDHLKKHDMAREAERLIAGTGWAPTPLRTPDAQSVGVEAESRAETLPAVPADGEDNEADDPTAADPEEPHVVAAE